MLWRVDVFLDDPLPRWRDSRRRLPAPTRAGSAAGDDQLAREATRAVKAEEDGWPPPSGTLRGGKKIGAALEREIRDDRPRR